MKIGIIAAMEQELVLLVEQLENKVEETVLGNTYYTGRLGKHDVVLVQSGVGKVNGSSIFLKGNAATAVMILVRGYTWIF